MAILPVLGPGGHVTRDAGEGVARCPGAGEGVARCGRGGLQVSRRGRGGRQARASGSPGAPARAGCGVRSAEAAAPSCRETWAVPRAPAGAAGRCRTVRWAARSPQLPLGPRLPAVPRGGEGGPAPVLRPSQWEPEGHQAAVRAKGSGTAAVPTPPRGPRQHDFPIALLVM